MNKPDFLRWFNRGFWKACSRRTFPIEIPKTPAEKAALLKSVYDDIALARYAPAASFCTRTSTDMSALEPRLHKLEEALLPKPWQPVCILTEPASDAPAEEWTDYQRQVEAAKARGDFVIVLAPMKPSERRRTEKGVTYCAGELDAFLLEASRLPSARGDDSLLVDVLKDAMGNTIALHNANSNYKHEARHTMCRMTCSR